MSIESQQENCFALTKLAVELGRRTRENGDLGAIVLAEISVAVGMLLTYLTTSTDSKGATSFQMSIDDKGTWRAWLGTLSENADSKCNAPHVAIKDVVTVMTAKRVLAIMAKVQDE